MSWVLAQRAGVLVIGANCLLMHSFQGEEVQYYTHALRDMQYFSNTNEGLPEPSRSIHS